MLIDGSALLTELRISPEDLAKAIRADIKEKTRCTASVGMGEYYSVEKMKTVILSKKNKRNKQECFSPSSGSNILLARLATRKAKPDGQYFLRSEDVDDFIRDLPVTSLPGKYSTTCWSRPSLQAVRILVVKINYHVLLLGVGPVMGRKMAAMGVRTCGDLQQVSLSRLQKKFGPRTGQTLFRFCRGLDDRPVRYEKGRKSVSAGMNYNIRFTQVRAAFFHV